MPPTLTVNLSDLIDRATEARNKARDEGDQIIAKSAAENRAMTTEERAELADAQKRMKEAQENLNAYKAQADVPRDDVDDAVTRRLDQPSGDRNPGGGDNRETESPEEREYREAFGSYLRRGINGITPDERELLQSNFDQSKEIRALTTTVGASGAFTIPTILRNRIIELRKKFNWIDSAGVFRLNTESGEAIQWPKTDGTAEVGEIINENTAANELDPSFSQVTINAYLYSSKMVKVPNTLLMDTIVDLEGLLARRLAERLGRIFNQHATTGTGSSQPNGIVTAATVGKTAAAAAAITYDELVDLEHSVDPAYRDGESVRFMFHDTTLALFRKLKDGDGRPLWQPSLIAGVASTLNGHRYIINQNMAVPATTAKTVIFGDLSAYLWREVGGMMMLRLSERFAESFQTAFLAFARADGELTDATAVKVLQQA